MAEEDTNSIPADKGRAATPKRMKLRKIYIADFGLFQHENDTKGSF